jgi:hypothetical protein
VWPLGPPEPVGNVFELHDAAGIQLRVLPHLHEFWAAVIASTLGFSGIRLHNAVPIRPLSHQNDAVVGQRRRCATRSLLRRTDQT